MVLSSGIRARPHSCQDPDCSASWTDLWRPFHPRSSVVWVYSLPTVLPSQSLRARRIFVLVDRISQAHLVLLAPGQCRLWRVLHPRRFHLEVVSSRLPERVMLLRFRQWVPVAMIVACERTSEPCSGL